MAHYANTVETLKGKWKRLGDAPELRHRLRRCFSWLERAGSENDTDTKCILFWVAFNAAYAIERKAAREEWGGNDPKERQLQRRYFERLTGVEFPKIHGTIKRELWDPVDRLMNNEYIFRGFWDSLTDQPFDWKNWRYQRQFEQERAEVKKRLRRGRAENSLYVLDRVFDRLSVLRNQLMHGCATQEGALNRRQVNDGAEILEVLVPLFVNIMADHPDENWGKISYPVREDIREDRR